MGVVVPEPEPEPIPVPDPEPMPEPPIGVVVALAGWPIPPVLPETVLISVRGS